jgi:hypothetical protein
MQYNEVSIDLGDLEEEAQHKADISKSTEIFSEIINDEEKDFNQNKPNMDWNNYDCGGKDCHGTSECKPNECKCENRMTDQNLPMLHSLCIAMMQLSKPHRENNKQSWTNFQQIYFSVRKNEIPTIFRDKYTLEAMEELGKFLQFQWSVAKKLFVNSLHSEKPKTPFLCACAEVINDKNAYEKEVSKILYSFKHSLIIIIIYIGSTRYN